MLHDEGGRGRPILLLHGLMGSAATWRRQLDWLRSYGHVYTLDALGHGRPAPVPITTEAFVADIVALTAGIDEPMTVIGHSMGGLHGWMLAASHPAGVRALVVEDMSPDFRGRTAESWVMLIRLWPQPFPDARAVLDYFGPVAGRYFLEAFVRGPDGYRLHGQLQTFSEIAEEWGRRDFWSQWESLRCPALLIEGEYGVTPPGQMVEMALRHGAVDHVLIPGAGHLVHDGHLDAYRAAVTSFLSET